METVKADESSESGFVPPRWVGLSSIERAREYNVQWIGWLCLRAIEGGASVTASFLARNRDLWGRIDVEAQARAAEFPFLILDLRLIEATETVRLAPRDSCEDLLLDTLLTARQFAEADRTTAQMMFGVDAAAAASFASMSVPQARPCRATALPLGGRRAILARLAAGLLEGRSSGHGMPAASRNPALVRGPGRRNVKSQQYVQFH